MKRFAGSLLALAMLLSGCSQYPELASHLNRYGLDSAADGGSLTHLLPASLQGAVIPENSARAEDPSSSGAEAEIEPQEVPLAIPSQEEGAPPDDPPPVPPEPESGGEPEGEPSGASASERPVSSSPRPPAPPEEPRREPDAPPPSSPEGDTTHSVGTLPEQDYQAQYDISSKLVLEEYYLPAIEEEILTLTNQRRESLGLPALELSAELRQAARLRSREMFYYNYFEHLRPNGDAWYTALDAMGLPRCHASENIAKGSYEGVPGQSENLLSAAFWQNQWEESPSHYEGIIDPDVTKIGVGFYYVITDGLVEVYSAVLFADL